MKKILFILLLFVNLQCVIHQDGDIELRSFTTAEAQHMTREPGDNCYSADIGWYHSPISDCSEPESIEYCCKYCPAHFDNPGDRDYHQENCSKKPSDNRCPWCQSTFGSDSELNSHKENCGPEKCNYSGCGMRFKTKSELDEHMKSHENKDKDKDKDKDRDKDKDKPTGGGGGGPAGGGPAGGGSGGGGKNEPSPNKLLCQDRKLHECIPTAIANSNIFKGTMSRSSAENVRKEIKDWYTEHDSTDFAQEGIFLGEIPLLLEKYGIVEGESTGTNEVSAWIRDLDNNNMLLGAFKPNVPSGVVGANLEDLTPGDFDDGKESHVVNVVGHEKADGKEKFKVFDPYWCRYYLIDPNFFIVCYPVSISK